MDHFPSGASTRGRAQVSERLDWVATQYRDGARTHQEIARHIGKDLAYVVLRETIRFKSPIDGRAMIQELRVTQVCPGVHNRRGRPLPDLTASTPRSSRTNQASETSVVRR